MQSMEMCMMLAHTSATCACYFAAATHAHEINIEEVFVKIGVVFM